MGVKMQGFDETLGELVAIKKSLGNEDAQALMEVARAFFAGARERGEVVEVPPSVVIDCPGVGVPDDRLDFLGLLATALCFLTDENVKALMLRLRELTRNQQGDEPGQYGAN